MIDSVISHVVCLVLGLFLGAWLTYAKKHDESPLGMSDKKPKPKPDGWGRVSTIKTESEK